MNIYGEYTKMTKIYCVDVETSGLRSRDVVFSIGISKVDIDKKTVKPVYDRVLGYDTSEWNHDKKNAWIFENSDLKLTDIKKSYIKGDHSEKIGQEVYDLLKNQSITMYNIGFDYPFLKRKPFNISRKTSKILQCLMLACTPICKLPFEVSWSNYSSGHKWPTLTESYEMLVNKKIQKSLNINWHSAISDTVASGYLLLELIENHNYKV